MRSPDIEMAVRLYYEKPEITNADIKELFSTGETQTIKIKKAVKEEMAKRGVKIMVAIHKMRVFQIAEPFYHFRRIDSIVCIIPGTAQNIVISLFFQNGVQCGYVRMYI